MYKIKKILAYLSQRYALDLRALALLRIGLAAVVIADLCIRLGDLRAHYTNDGVWPADLVYSFGWQTGFWSLHALSGTVAWQLVLFGLHGLAAFFLLIGFRTKLMTVLVWLLTISLHNRNVYILQAGDDLLRLVLFWGLFLPWNQFYAIDAKHQPLKQFPLANLGYLLLMASVYFFTVILKTGPEWHQDHSAVYYALSLEQLRLPITGDWLYHFPKLMQVLTWLVYYTELAIGLLIICPSKKGNLRYIAFVLIVLLQVGIGLTVYVGLFFIISMISALALLPKSVMDRVDTLLKQKRKVRQYRKPYIGLNYVRNVVCLLAIVFCMIINFSSLNWFTYQLRTELITATNLVRFNQYWGMFSPGILKKDGWFVYYGTDTAGRQWDLRKNSDYVDFEKPAHIVSLHKNDRWRKLAENLQTDNAAFLRPLYGKYVLHQWNIHHPEKKMSSLQLYFMEKENLPDYKTTAIQKKLFSVNDEN